MSLLPKQTTIFLPDLFKALEALPDRESKIQILKEFAKKEQKYYDIIRAFTELMWHPAVKFGLPKGAPKYAIPTEFEGEAPTSLFKVFKNIGLFLEGSRTYIMNPIKREFHFLSQLESLSKNEGEILICIKDRNIETKYPSVTCDLFCEAFADYNFLPKEVVEANPPQTTPKK